MFKSLIFLILLGISPYFLIAQINITGKIYDKITKQPIPNCSIFSLDHTQGTLSNEDGEFNLHITNIKAPIYVSHISYKKVRLDITQKQNFEVELEQASIHLPELTVQKSVDNYIRLALLKASKDTLTNYYFKGYLRETSTENSDIKSFNEIIFDAEWNTRGISRWIPRFSRFAINEDVAYKSSHFFNFYISFVRTGIIARGNLLPTSLLTDIHIYNLKIINTFLRDNTDEIVEISCIPKEKKKPYFEGIIVVNTTSDNIIQIRGTYFQETSKFNIAKNQTYEYKVNFKETSTQNAYFDNFTMYTKAKVKSTKIEHQTTIFNFEPIDKEPNDLKSIKISQAHLQQKKYNDAFWKSFEIIKYTDLQKEVIEKFQKKGQFISNFITK